MNSRAKLWAALLLMGTAACQAPTVAEFAEVQFRIDAPLCGGSRIAYQWSIDHKVVGSDTLSDRQYSSLYGTPAGQHVIGAVIPGTVFSRDTTVTLEAGKIFLETVPVYCS